ncbi:hypothetical protein TA3x_004165 [Tundrisphaera sp. TA3]|uniref:hypothetical protein n=1 Tax=Tundrisphaera sp. TA3 TaxID=3435775 RepID=UPI003EB77DC2
MTPRRPGRVGPVAILLPLLLLACFGRLVARPSGLIVDANRPSLDHARRADDPPSIGNDATRLFIPHHAAIAGHLARLGRVPAWDDRGFGGRPLVGNPQAGLFYPPTWLAWRFWFPGILGWMTALHLLWGGFGTYGLARISGIDRWGSVVSAGCFQASPYVLAQAFEGHYPHVWSASWMPWAFLAMSGARRGQILPGLMLVPILAGSALAGHLQEAYLLAVALLAWWLHDLIALGRTGPGLTAVGRSAAACIGLTLLIVGVTANEWLPDLLVSPYTLRNAALPADQAGRYHLFPINALQLLSPFALGRPGDYFGHDNYWEALTSIGLIPLALAVTGLALAPDRRAVRGWTILVLVSIWVAAGRQLGLFTILYEALPGFGRFRVPARTLFLASLGASLLAGFGVDSLRRIAGQPDAWAAWCRVTARITLILAGLVLAGTWAQAFASPADPTIRRIPDYARILPAISQVGHQWIFWLALMGLWVASRFGRSSSLLRGSLATWLGLWGLAELGAYGASLILVAPPGAFLGPDPISSAIERDRGPGVNSAVMIRAVDPFYDDLRAGAHGYRKTNVNDSFQIRHAATIYEPLYRTFTPEPWQLDRPMDSAVSDHRRAIRQHNLDRMGVQYLIGDTLRLDPRWPIVVSGSWKGRPFSVCRNPTAYPRTYFIPDDPPDEVPSREPSIGHKQPARSLPRWMGHSPDLIDIEMVNQGRGQLIVTETWMPGWQVSVNGRPARMRRTIEGQMAVDISGSGGQKVRYEYKAPGKQAGLQIFWTSLLVWILLCANELRRGRRQRLETSETKPLIESDCPVL